MGALQVALFDSPWRLARRIALMVFLGCFASSALFWAVSYLKNICGGTVFSCDSVTDVLTVSLVSGGFWAIVLVPSVTLVATPIVHYLGQLLRPNTGAGIAVVLAPVAAVLACSVFLVLIFSSFMDIRSWGFEEMKRLLVISTLVGLANLCVFFVGFRLWVKTR